MKDRSKDRGFPYQFLLQKLPHLREVSVNDILALVLKRPQEETHLLYLLLSQILRKKETRCNNPLNTGPLLTSGGHNFSVLRIL